MPTITRFRRAKRAMAGTSIATMAVAALFMTSAFNAVTSSAATHSVVKPDYAYFQGKTINFLIGQSPGGSYAPLLIPANIFVANFLHATINNVYVPQANGTVEADEVAAATPDGLTIGIEHAAIALSTVFETGTTGYSFPWTKLSFIAGTHAIPEAIVACHGSSISTIGQALHSKTPVGVINSGNGPGFEFVKSVFNSYGAPVQSVSGFSTSAAQQAACFGGDLPLALQSVTALTPAEFQQGDIKPLILTVQVSKASSIYPYLKNVPTIAQYEAAHKPTTPAGKVAGKLVISQYGISGIGPLIAGPSGLAKGPLLALQNAYKLAIKSASVQASMVAAGDSPGWFAATAIVPWYKQLLKHQTLMSQFLNQVYTS